MWFKILSESYKKKTMWELEKNLKNAKNKVKVY